LRAKASIFLLLFAAQLLVGAALAHRAPESNSSIEWNKRSQRFEVIHRLHQHDLQGLMRQRGYSDMSTLRARAAIALLVAESFSLSNEQGQPIPMATLGAELEANYVVVMQEFEKPDNTVLSVRIDLHRLLLPNHVSLLRLLRPGANTLLRFAAGGNSQSVRLE